MQKGNWNSALNRREWMMTAGGLLLAAGYVCFLANGNPVR